MAQLIGLRETIRNIYQKHGAIIRAVAKALLSFFVLYFLSQMFGYDSRINQIYIFAAISVIQAFLPVSFLYYTGSLLIAGNLFALSPDIMLVFLTVVIACRLCFIYVEGSYTILVMLVPVLFFLKLEYFIPVLVGMIYGVGGVLPVLGGILIYYISTCSREVSVLLAASDGSETGLGLQKIIEMFTQNREMFVIAVAFCLAVFISAILYRTFHERAWQLAVVFGNVALAFILLAGRLIFELDYPVWRVFLSCVLAAVVDTVYQFFRGIGDLSRIEKVSFEDDEYIYYVKAVPKFQLTRTDRSVTRIQPEDEWQEPEMQESQKRRRKGRHDRKEGDQKSAKAPAPQNDPQAEKPSGGRQEEGDQKSAKAPSPQNNLQAEISPGGRKEEEDQKGAKAPSPQNNPQAEKSQSGPQEEAVQKSLKTAEDMKEDLE